MWDKVRGYAVMLGLAVVFATGADASAADPNLAARVNGVGISVTTLNRTFDAYSNRQGRSLAGIRQPQQYKKLRRKVLDILISQELLWQQAQRLDLVASKEEVDRRLGEFIASHRSRDDYVLWLRKTGISEEAYTEDLKRRLTVDRLLAQISNSIPISDEEIHEYYLANRHSFSQPEQVHARHILIKVQAAADEATRAAAKQRIGDILAQAREGADFAELAKQYSEGPTGPKGGDLGFFGRGQMVPAFEAAAFALQPGEISDPVETRFGYHIIKLEAHRSEQALGEQAVREDIRRYLRSTRSDEAIEKRIDSLRAEAEIEILVP